MIISLIIWIVFGVTIMYLIVIGILTYGWFNLSVKNHTNNINEVVKVTVLVAVRNESSNIQNLLVQLINQSYTSELYDVIIVDDHSTDDTKEKIKQVQKEFLSPSIKLISATGNGKKNALKEGLLFSQSELIITTDGDCNVRNGWISSIVNHYKLTNQQVILGPVIYEYEKSILQKFFSLDFVSLVVSGAGSVGAGLPLMGNGANLAFRREVTMTNIKEKEKYASGDDVFLIHRVASKFGFESVGFLKNEEAIVSTPPPKGYIDFLKQRIRWASKAKGYQLTWPIVVSVVVFLFNLFLFLLLVGSVYYTWLFPIYMLLIVTKFFIDLPIVFSFLDFSSKARLKPLFFFVELLYPIYIVGAATVSFMFGFEWKGRKNLR